MGAQATGPSIADVRADIIAGGASAPDGRYRYEVVGGLLYAVGEFGRARVGLSLEMEPDISGSDRG